MTQYYYVGTLLPELSFQLEPEITFTDFDLLLRQNLTEGDYGKTFPLRLFFDLENLRLYWSHQGDSSLALKMDPKGNLNPRDLEESLLSGERLPLWLRDYLAEYESDAERLAHFPKLWALFFKNEGRGDHDFLKKYLSFERGLRLTLAAYRAKRLGKNLYKELQYEDADDPLVAELLAQKDAKDFVPPEEYSDLLPLLEASSDDPDLISQALLNYRFEKVESFAGASPFSIDRILSYAVRLFLVEEKFRREKVEGSQILDTLITQKEVLS